MSVQHPPLTSRQQELVRLINRGFTRWKIAQLMGVRETDLRVMINVLCARYDCRMRDLPRRVRETSEGVYTKGGE